MTKHIYQLATRLQPVMAAKHTAAPPHVRDAWACLTRWHDAGEPIRRLTDADVEAARSGVPADLRLATAPVRSPAVLYILDRSDWMIVARHDAGEPVRIAPDVPPVAYPEPMLTYATELPDGSIASGAINLDHAPTIREVRIEAGTSLLAGERLEQIDLQSEMLRLAICLHHFYGQVA